MMCHAALLYRQDLHPRRVLDGQHGLLVADQRRPSSVSDQSNARIIVPPAISQTRAVLWVVGR
jgi:DNA-binding cell septation regulator SpoVG